MWTMLMQTIASATVIGSRADIDRLTELVEELRIDSEDVILSGEYESRAGNLVRVRDLNLPLEDA